MTFGIKINSNDPQLVTFFTNATSSGNSQSVSVIGYDTLVVEIYGEGMADADSVTIAGTAASGIYTPVEPAMSSITSTPIVKKMDLRGLTSIEAQLSITSGSCNVVGTLV